MGLTAVSWHICNILPQYLRWIALIPVTLEAFPILSPKPCQSCQMCDQQVREKECCQVPSREQGKKRPHWRTWRKTGSHWSPKATIKKIKACSPVRQARGVERQDYGRKKALLFPWNCSSDSSTDSPVSALNI